MILGVLKEPTPETRVSLHPEAVKALVSAGNKVLVETGAGNTAYLSDELYREARDETLDRSAIMAQSEMIFQIRPLGDAEWRSLSQGKIVVGVYQPLVARELMAEMAKQGITLFSMDSIPTISRAQSMDVLSSQSTVSGYIAVLLAATHLPRFFPTLMTAAGTIPPAKALVIGAGVACL